MDIQELRKKLSAKSGPAYWKSLDELAESEDFKRYVEREFPHEAHIWDETLSRRNFLKVMGSALMMGAVSGCGKQPPERIVPYVRQPEEIIPGRPLYYATASSYSGGAQGILVESHMGCPTHIAGNPEHPASLGACDAITQAGLLDLYDPDRSQVVTRQGRISTWEAFLLTLETELKAQSAKKGSGLRVLTSTVRSPTLARQLQDLMGAYPEARWHQYEPVLSDNARDAGRRSFGRFVERRFEIGSADVIVSFGEDFLFNRPGSVRYARDFAARRDPRLEHRMSRLYVAETNPSVTGSMADHRLSVSYRSIEHLARALACELGLQKSGTRPELPGTSRDWLSAVVKDLQAHRGSCLVVAGRSQPVGVHVLADAINDVLGNALKTVIYTKPVDEQPLMQMQSLAGLVADMNAGRVEVLLILGGNPVYDAPADLSFDKALAKVPFAVRTGLYHDETSFHCRWHIPALHFLESWSDTRAFDGSVSIVQPLIEPLYGGKSYHRLVGAFLGKSTLTEEQWVRDSWKQTRPENFEVFWKTTLHDGIMEESSFPALDVRFGSGALDDAFHDESGRTGEAGGGLEILFEPDPTVWDGEFANNGWLQELPKPMTKLTWDNPLLISPRLAGRMGLESGDLVRVKSGDRTLDAPVWIMPGQAETSITAFMGYGRRRSGAVAKEAGFDVYSLRTAPFLWRSAEVVLERLGGRYPLACTQDHFTMAGRALVRSATLGEYLRHPGFARDHHEPGPGETLYPAFEAGEYAWGMSINLNTCIGCNACVIACQTENNIPVVGKDQVRRGREMHWIRVDRYFEGDMDDPVFHQEPVPCMHCENAPCEPVCPVGATVHSKEGLNEQVYNRCVGTRYCANNCPYKVRRFNFLQYADLKTENLKPARNPDVTVRTRGIIEKCTFCVQRINQARIQAGLEDRKIRDGDVVTACQAACPVQAIVFGDIGDKSSRVSIAKSSPLNYTLMAQLGTRPRTSYLAKIRNLSVQEQDKNVFPEGMPVHD